MSSHRTTLPAAKLRATGSTITTSLESSQTAALVDCGLERKNPLPGLPRKPASRERLNHPRQPPRPGSKLITEFHGSRIAAGGTEFPCTAEGFEKPRAACHLDGREPRRSERDILRFHAPARPRLTPRPDANGWGDCCAKKFRTTKERIPGQASRVVLSKCENFGLVCADDGDVLKPHRERYTTQAPKLAGAIQAPNNALYCLDKNVQLLVRGSLRLAQFLNEA